MPKFKNIKLVDLNNPNDPEAKRLRAVVNEKIRQDYQTQLVIMQENQRLFEESSQPSPQRERLTSDNDTQETGQSRDDLLANIRQQQEKEREEQMLKSLAAEAERQLIVSLELNTLIDKDMHHLGNKQSVLDAKLDSITKETDPTEAASILDDAAEVQAQKMAKILERETNANMMEGKAQGLRMFLQNSPSDSNSSGRQTIIESINRYETHAASIKRQVVEERQEVDQNLQKIEKTCEKVNETSRAQGKPEIRLDMSAKIDKWVKHNQKLSEREMQSVQQNQSSSRGLRR